MDDNTGKIASRIARRKMPSRQIQILRLLAKVMLGVCAFFYIIGTDSMKGKAILGFFSILMVFGISYLIPYDRDSSDLES